MSALPLSPKHVLLMIAALLLSCGPESSMVEDGPFVPGGGTVRLAAVDDCAGGQASLASTGGDTGEDKLLATVEQDGTVRFVHSGAVFNCCMERVDLQLYSWGSILRVVETERCPEPCRCTCAYTVHGEITDLEPGWYTLEICADSVGRDVLSAVRFRIQG